MKTVRPFRFALLAAALAMAGAAAAKEGPLDGVSRQFEDLIRSADTQALAAMYAEDAVVMPPNHAPVKGYTDAGFTLKLTPAAIWMDGALAVRSGSYVLLDKEQKEAEHGKWM